MVLTLYAKQRILFHYYNGSSSSNRIKKLLEEDGIITSRVTVWKFIHHFRETQCISRKEGSGRPTKITTEVKRFVSAQMEEDDETTAYQLHKKLTDNGHFLSISTILRCRLDLGWTFRGTLPDAHVIINQLSYGRVGSAYCQLIRTYNKEKRLAWAGQFLSEAKDGFENVIWSDESTVQVETHKRYCYRKAGCPPKSKPRFTIIMTIYTCMQKIIYI